MKPIKKIALTSTVMAAFLSTAAFAQEASGTNDPMQGQNGMSGQMMQGNMSGIQGMEGMMPMMNMMMQMGPMMKACTEMMQAMSDHSETGKPETNEG